MTLTSADPTVQSAYRYGALALLAAAGALAIALGYQHLGGLEPCELCLKQRYAYYAGVPLLFLGLVSLSAGQTRIAALLFGLVALGFLGNAGLGVYHAGVEWKFWEGPSACAGAQQITSNAGNMLEALELCQNAMLVTTPGELFRVISSYGVAPHRIRLVDFGEELDAGDRVLRSLGLELRAPFPKGYTLEQGDWALLDPVKERSGTLRR